MRPGGEQIFEARGLGCLSNGKPQDPDPDAAQSLVIPSADAVVLRVPPDALSHANGGGLRAGLENVDPGQSKVVAVVERIVWDLAAFERPPKLLVGRHDATVHSDHPRARLGQKN